MGFPRSLRLAVALALGCLFVLALAGGTRAGEERTGMARALVDCTTTTTNDGPAMSGSLRDCVIQADQSPGSTIDLQSGAIYTLTIPDAGSCDGGDTEQSAATGDLDVTASTTINGNGATIEAAPALCNRVFDVRAAVTLANLTIEGGFSCNAPSGIGGAGILNAGAQLTLDNVLVRNNTSNCRGAGIENEVGATATLNSSTVSGNSSPNGGGGGIYNLGTLTLNGSTVSGNDGHGGGGGGIADFAGTLTATASTIANNTGSGLYNTGSPTGPPSQATLTNTTITGNNSISTRAGGIHNDFSTVTVRDSIVAGNSGGINGTLPDCGGNALAFGTEWSGHFNVYGGDMQCPHNSDSNDIFPASPGLGQLGHFGGPTKTMLVLPGSPVIDHGYDFEFRGTDQRGFPEFNMIPDSGAF